MKGKGYLIAIFSLCVFTATAQHQITGTVKDAATGSPVPYATAALLRPDSSAVIRTYILRGKTLRLCVFARDDYFAQRRKG